MSVGNWSRHLLRILWWIGVGASLFWVGALLSETVFRFRTYTSAWKGFMPLYEVPFPAVTLCSQVKHRNVSKVTSVIMNNTEGLSPDEMSVENWSRYLLRVLWWTGVGASLFWGGALLSEAIFKHRTFFTFWEEPMPLHEVPFPAVTLCSQIKYKNAKVTSVIMNNTEGLSPDEVKMMSDASMVCDHHVHVPGSNTTDESLKDFIKLNAPPFDEVLYACTWENVLVNCSDFFTETLTSEGLCFTANMLTRDYMFRTNRTPKSEWSPANGYSYGAPLENAYPRRSVLTGPRYGLNMIMLSFNDDHSHVCKGPLQGFKIQIHSPMEYPYMDSGYIRVPTDQEVLIGVEPEVRKENTERWTTPSRRGCYYNSEKKLAYFREYSRRNCEFECIKNKTIETCHCLPFHLHDEGDTVPLCGPGSKSCAINVPGTVKKEEVKDRMEYRDGTCDCLPECDSVEYRFEASQSDFHWGKVIKAYGDTHNYSGYSMSRATIYIKDSSFVRQHSSYPLVVRRYGSAGALLFLTGLCLLMYMAVIFYVDRQEVARNSRTSGHHNVGEEPLTSYMETP